MDQSVVIAIDHSPQSENAVKFYLEKVHRPGNKAVLVHCIELPEFAKARDSNVSPSVLANLWKEEEARTKTLEEKMRTLLKDKEVPGTLRTATGKPGEVICQVADETAAVMIITGTRSIGKMKRTILGSVSDYLVNHATCPVMVVRDPAEIERKRRPSAPEGSKSKSRHASGDSVGSFTANLRQRFASGGKSRSVSGDKEDPCLRERKKDSRARAEEATAEEDEDVEAPLAQPKKTENA